MRYINLHLPLPSPLNSSVSIIQPSTIATGKWLNITSLVYIIRKVKLDNITEWEASSTEDQFFD